MSAGSVTAGLGASLYGFGVGGASVLGYPNPGSTTTGVVGLANSGNGAGGSNAGGGTGVAGSAGGSGYCLITWWQ